MEKVFHITKKKDKFQTRWKAIQIFIFEWNMQDRFSLCENHAMQKCNFYPFFLIGVGRRPLYCKNCFLSTAPRFCWERYMSYICVTIFYCWTGNSCHVVLSIHHFVCFSFPKSDSNRVEMKFKARHLYLSSKINAVCTTENRVFSNI